MAVGQGVVEQETGGVVQEPFGISSMLRKRIAAEEAANLPRRFSGCHGTLLEGVKVLRNLIDESMPYLLEVRPAHPNRWLAFGTLLADHLLLRKAECIQRISEFRSR